MKTQSVYEIFRMIVVVVTIWFVVQTWLVMGLVVPVLVSGSSMSPTLQGPRRLYRCEACGHEFATELDEYPDGATAFCRRCRKWSAKAVPGGERSGDRILIDRTAYVLRAPRRWDLVVFRSPENASQLVVKRVVGLPGETIFLADGDVWIDGRRMANPQGTKYDIRDGDRPQFPFGQAGARAGWRVGPTEFFVMGDHAEVSDDSRDWPFGPGLDAKLIIGRPVGVR